MAKAIHRCMTKATTAEGDGVRHSFNWTVSRRGILEVRPDALVCGNWIIPYSEIDEAVLYSVRQMLIPGYVLVVKTQGMTYQFGLNGAASGPETCRSQFAGNGLGSATPGTA